MISYKIERSNFHVLSSHADCTDHSLAKDPDDDPSLLLDSADLFLTKAGGISATEGAVKGIPMLFIDTISGCEKYNRQFYENTGAALSRKTPGSFARVPLLYYPIFWIMLLRSRYVSLLTESFSAPPKIERKDNRRL